MDDIERALLAEIREHPDDDAPRFVYADHLIAKGDARGDFITAGLRRKDDEVRSLWDEHREWQARLPPWSVTPELERGFVSALTFEGRLIDLLPHVPEVIALTPVPVVKVRGEAVLNFHLRDDGTVGAIVHWERDARTHVVTVVDVPTLKGRAQAKHRVSLHESFDLLAIAHTNRLRFARDRDVVIYELVIGQFGTQRQRCELAF